MGRLAAFLQVRKALRLYDRGEYAAAEEALEGALAERPGLAERDQYRGILALKQGRVEEALPLLRQAYEKDEAIPAAVALGAAELLRGRGEEARRWFGRALDAFPVMFELSYHVGLSWLREKKKRKAIEVFASMLAREDEPLFQRLDRLREAAGEEGA